MEDFGEVLRQKIKNGDLSQTELAARANVDPATLSRFLTGKRQGVHGMRLSAYNRLCNVVGLEMIQGEHKVELANFIGVVAERRTQKIWERFLATLGEVEMNIIQGLNEGHSHQIIAERVGCETQEVDTLVNMMMRRFDALFDK